MYCRSILYSLEEHQALVKQFARMLDFVFRFDESKMKTPDLTNDISYFRRAYGSRRASLKRRVSEPTPRPSGLMDDLSYDAIEENLPMDFLGKLVRYFGEPTPMLKQLSSSVSTYIAKNAEDPVISSNTSELFGKMAKVCMDMVNSPTLSERIQDQDTKELIVRVIVGLVIVYDHTNPSGAFAKGNLLFYAYKLLLQKCPL